eukprot:266883_1
MAVVMAPIVTFLMIPKNSPFVIILIRKKVVGMEVDVIINMSKERNCNVNQRDNCNVNQRVQITWRQLQSTWGRKYWQHYNMENMVRTGIQISMDRKVTILPIFASLLVNQADPMLKSCWTDDEYHTALEAAQNVRVNDTEDMKKIIAMITVVHDLWKKLNP